MTKKKTNNNKKYECFCNFRFMNFKVKKNLNKKANIIPEINPRKDDPSLFNPIFFSKLKKKIQ